MPRFPEPEFPRRMGPYGAPRPGEKAPHRDAGQLVSDFIGDIQNVGETICNALDKPLDQAVGVKGPHRLVDGVNDYGTDVVKGIVDKVTRWR